MTGRVKLRLALSTFPFTLYFTDRTNGTVVVLSVDVRNVTFICTCRQLKRIEHVQNALADMDAMKKVLPIMARTGDDIVREVLSFLAAILFNGNEQVQVITTCLLLLVYC